MVAGGFAAQCRKMIDLSAELVFEVMNDRARRRNCLGQIGAAEPVDGFYIKVLAEGGGGGRGPVGVGWAYRGGAGISVRLWSRSLSRGFRRCGRGSKPGCKRGNWRRGLSNGSMV